MEKEITTLFIHSFEEIDNILNSNFYKETDKNNLKKIRKKLSIWYNNYKEKSTLKTINPRELEYIDLEITSLFDKYYQEESLKENYTERLSYDFSHLEHYWKDEMLGEKND